MKNKLSILALLVATHLTHPASSMASDVMNDEPSDFPKRSEVTCKSSQFPNTEGSELTLKFKNSKPYEAYLYLGKKDPFQTTGWYDAHTALNENHTPVIYLTWNAGAGREPTPRSMVIYAFEANYRHNKSLFLGVIEWTSDGKMEKHYSFICD